MATQKENPFLSLEKQITEAGMERLEGLVSDPRGSVYAFRLSDSQIKAAAGMARLSRRDGNLLVTILDEFELEDAEAADKLIDRVVTGFGDDSVQQLLNLSVVVERVSNLATKKVEYGRFMNALEQSSRYIPFDNKDEHGQYMFLRLEYLPDDLKAQYEETMNAIFDGYSEVVRVLTDYVRQHHPQGDDSLKTWEQVTRAQALDVARVLLPAATRSTVGLYGSTQAFEALIIRLLSEDLPESRQLGQQILKQCRKVAPTFFKRADRPDRGGAISAYRAANQQAMRALEQELVKPVRQPKRASVKLLDHWPHYEDQLIAGMLFKPSGQSMVDLLAQVRGFDRDQRARVIAAYIGDRTNRRQKPGRAIEKAHFEFEIVGDYGTFRDIQRHRVLDAFEWQDLTIDLGYAVPKLAKEAGLEKEFRRIFRLSENLYRKMVAAGHSEDAQYATLFGHRMRYRFVVDLKEFYHLIELRTTPQGHPGYRKICQAMFRQVRSIYPSLAMGMRFVNQGEDPELTRLAEARANEFKLMQAERAAIGGI